MISIVMPMWNRKSLLIETVESVLAQTYKDFEFIIIDDGSTDGATEIIELYAKKDSRIILLKQKHSGSTDAWNLGFKKIRGDAVCILGSDDLWTPNKLERQVEVAKKYPNYILHTNSISIDEDGNEIVKTYFPDATSEGYKKRALGAASPWFATSSWYIPRPIFDKVGEFEGEYNDYQWIMRAIILHNADMKLIPEFLCKHRSTANSNTFKHIGQAKFKELANEIQKTMMDKIRIQCGNCGEEIPRRCPKCAFDLRKKENLASGIAICKVGIKLPNHCSNCWRDKE